MKQIKFIGSEAINDLLQKFFLPSNLTSNGTKTDYEVVAKKYIGTASKKAIASLRDTIIEMKNLVFPEELSFDERHDVLLGFVNLKITILNILDSYMTSQIIQSKSS